MLKPELHRRYWLIELISYWEGRLTTGHLRQFFGISRQQASKDINQYQQDHTSNLEYCPSRKGYLPGKHFNPAHISADVAEYLNWVTGQSAHTMPADPGYRLEHAILLPPARNVSPNVIRPLVHALRHHERLDVDYGAVSSSDRDGRIIVPVLFVNTGSRWHLRAWCEKAQNYRDFVLSRFHGTPTPEGKPLAPLPPDTRWNTHITLHITPDPRLSPEQQQALIHDYAMNNGRLEINTRAALAGYLLREMQINTKMLDINPAAQQLILANYDEVKEWLF
ncbi:WYL domain-containing protein [Oceanimonas sp. CAM02]|uniref:WYL domain-containing protein n=1 Tax=Oceanimonas sp. CAM02 TaxID=3080336 RepID=UPI002935E02A|nr:WYL domain-containing protein [Oceanimonas sp. CAM02]MDV2857829.1 WYL domain-containing protein [Oceanimonas sp. CAM02]